MTLRASLPDLDRLDSAALKALIFLQQSNFNRKTAAPLQDERLASREAEIEQLKLLIAKLRRMQFGRKSKKMERQIEKLRLRLDELQARQAENATSCQILTASEDSAEATGVSGLRRRAEVISENTFRRSWNGFPRSPCSGHW